MKTDGHGAGASLSIHTPVQISDSIFKQPSAFSRRDAPEFCTNIGPRKKEGAGKAGCPMHPQSRVEKIKPHERSHHRFTGLTRPSLRNGFNGFLRALPGDEFLFVTVIRGLKVLPNPVGPT